MPHSSFQQTPSALYLAAPSLKLLLLAYEKIRLKEGLLDPFVSNGPWWVCTLHVTGFRKHDRYHQRGLYEMMCCSFLKR
ncbi:hypothetical protein NC652_024492 [Populus alba x Populus x berolinensis]|nr:hypothetical protein NC652_024492 [Populus alba x Populus x berolinensis]